MGFTALTHLLMLIGIPALTVALILLLVGYYKEAHKYY